MKYLLVVLIGFLSACESSKRVVDVQRTITIDTSYTFLAEDGTTCRAPAYLGRGVKVGSIWSCMW